MRTLTRHLAPHARTAWLTFAAVAVLVVIVVESIVVLNDGGRMPIVGVAVAWLVAAVVLAAFLDAVLVPGNPDVRRDAGQAAGWSGALGAGASYDGGGHGGAGDGGASCG